MTLKLEVTVPEDDIKSGDGARYLARAMEAIGFTRGVTLPVPNTGGSVTALDGEQVTKALQSGADSVSPELAAQLDAAAAKTAGDTNSGAADPASTRAYGTSEEGRARRTKEQIADDKEIEELWTGDKSFIPTHIPATDLLAGLKDGSIKPTDTAPKANISTGEEHIDPTTAEEKAQDKADEQAEVDSTKGDKLTLDDLRKAAGDFSKRHGMAEAMEIIPDLLGCGLNEVPADEIADAIAKLEAYGGEKPADKPEEKPFTATKADVIEVMLQYADKFDGQRDDMTAMPVMTADRGKIFVAAMGEGIDGLSKMPDEPEAFGRVVLAFREALATNPFKREAKK